MKKFLLLALCLFFVLFSSNVSATHLVSLDGHITCIKNNQINTEYTVHIRSIRDADASSVPFDQTLKVGIYGKTDGKLKITVDIDLISETLLDQSVNGQDFLIEGEYFTTFQLPALSGGYVLQIRRCCLPSTQNLIDDMGMELLIFIPEGMQSGQHTLKRSVGMKAFLQKDLTYTFSYPWVHNLYDSIRFESKDIYTGGNTTNPMPGITPTIHYGPKAIFRNGFTSGNPLGSAGIWTKTTDSTYTMHMNNLGYYLYPINTTCYVNGDSFMQTILFPIFSVDSILTELRLELVSNDEDDALLSSTSKNWSSIDSIMLQRHDPLMPQNEFTTVHSNVAEGASVQLHDSPLSPNSDYLYRIKLVSGGQTHYSNEVLVRTFGVGLADISDNKNMVQVYPNPATSLLNILSPASIAYELYSINGQKMLKGIIEEGENILQIGHLPEGIYFLKTEFETVKIVVYTQP